MIILPLGKKIGRLGTFNIYRERSISEWLKDNLPEGTKFSIDSVEADGDTVDVRVTAQMPYLYCDEVEIKISKSLE